jgi:hypothetical protein
MSSTTSSDDDKLQKSKSIDGFHLGYPTSPELPGQQLCFHGYIYDKGSMRKVRYAYRYQQECNKFHIIKEWF